MSKLMYVTIENMAYGKKFRVLKSNANQYLVETMKTKKRFWVNKSRTKNVDLRTIKTTSTKLKKEIKEALSEKKDGKGVKDEHGNGS